MTEPSSVAETLVPRKWEGVRRQIDQWGWQTSFCLVLRIRNEKSVQSWIYWCGQKGDTSLLPPDFSKQHGRQGLLWSDQYFAGEPSCPCFHSYVVAIFFLVVVFSTFFKKYVIDGIILILKRKLRFIWNHICINTYCLHKSKIENLLSFSSCSEPS